jgi:hypothetical protein
MKGWPSLLAAGWTRPIPYLIQLEAAVGAADIVLTSHELQMLYYLDRADTVSARSAWPRSPRPNSRAIRGPVDAPPIRLDISVELLFGQLADPDDQEARWLFHTCRATA